MAETPDLKTIAFVAYPGITLLDLVGPLQVMSILTQLVPGFEAVVVAEKIEPLATDTPIQYIPNKTFAEVPNPHVIIVPGGTAPTMRALANEALLNYIRTAARGAEVVSSVCTGALVLGAAGLLDGKQATTHWSTAKQLNVLGAEYVAERWVEDGKVITSAGVSAGIDMALQLVARMTNEQVAATVQLAIEYDPHPPMGGIDWSKVDRHSFDPLVAGWLQEGLSDHPDLLAKLS